MDCIADALTVPPMYTALSDSTDHSHMQISSHLRLLQFFPKCIYIQYVLYRFRTYLVCNLFM
jgi:hypothetical protein